jgi:prepilin-type N-terminal cleavage/methylation domain-containing protein
MSVREETGFTLPELLIAMAMFVIILLATLSVFDRSSRLSSENAKQNDSLEESRVAIDQVARQLRNLASPTSPQSTIDTAAKYDLIFQTDDPTKTWVRYCLNTSTLYYAFSANALSATQKAACPGSGWPNGGVRVVAQHITNQAGGQDRPVFSYTCTAGSAAGCPASSADNSKIVLSGMTLYVDTNPGQAPAEKRVSSGVYLRNQNQPPVAAPFTVTPQPSPPRTVIFNGSASSDPEGRTLHYYWCDGAATQCTPTSSSFIGTGVTLTYTFPGSDHSQHPIVLTVVDPGGLATTTPPQNVIPQ